MIVYRYENHTGAGPYSAYRNEPGRTDLCTLSGHLCSAHSDGDHPTIEDDLTSRQLTNYIGHRIEYKHACFSLADLEDWFRGWEDVLNLHGFTIAKYKLDKCDEGKSWFVGQSKRQLIFHIDHATKLTESVEKGELVCQ